MKPEDQLDPALAPGHTDLMVTPESLDAWMEKNPLPTDPTRNERQRRFRERRKLGLVPASVGDVHGALPPKRAARVRQWLAEAEQDAPHKEKRQ